jgi:hypothetical protein
VSRYAVPYAGLGAGFADVRAQCARRSPVQHGQRHIRTVAQAVRKALVVSGDGLEWKREKWNALAKLIHRIGEWAAMKFADQVVVDNDEIRKYYLNKYQHDPAHDQVRRAK